MVLVLSKSTILMNKHMVGADAISSFFCVCVFFFRYDISE